MGAVAFGMTGDQVKQMLGQPDAELQGRSLIYSRMGFSVAISRKVGAYSLGFLSRKAMPPYMHGADFAGKTDKGIGIGAAEGQIRKAYGKPTKASRKGRQVTLSYERLGMTFILLNDRVVQFGIIGIRTKKGPR